MVRYLFGPGGECDGLLCQGRGDDPECDRVLTWTVAVAGKTSPTLRVSCLGTAGRRHSVLK